MMENKYHKLDYAAIWNTMKSNHVVRLALYVFGGLLFLFVAGKSFRIVASAVSGYREMVSAFKG